MTVQQYNPPHVGVLINRTFIEPFDNVSGNMVARELGVAPSTFSRLLKGESGLTPEMAVRLSAVLGGSAESWMRLQESYDLWKARQSIDISDFSKIDFAKFANAQCGRKIVETKRKSRCQPA